MNKRVSALRAEPRRGRYERSCLRHAEKQIRGFGSCTWICTQFWGTFLPADGTGAAASKKNVTNNPLLDDQDRKTGECRTRRGVEGARGRGSSYKTLFCGKRPRMTFVWDIHEALLEGKAIYNTQKRLGSSSATCCTILMQFASSCMSRSSVNCWKKT